MPFFSRTKKGIKEMKVFSAKNLSLANYLIENGCNVIKIKKNPQFNSMVLIDFIYDSVLMNNLTIWKKIKEDERKAKEIKE